MRLSLWQRFQGTLYAVFSTNPDLKIASSPPIQERLMVMDKTINKLQLGQVFIVEDWQDLIGENKNLLPFVLLPLALFRHEYPQAFQDQLTLLKEADYLTEEEKGAIAVWFRVLSLILREEFEGDWQTGKTEDWEEIVVKAIAERWPLAEVVHSLKNESKLTQGVALGLYSWLDTPAHFALSWQRSLLTGNPLAVFFASSLSGAYNGLNSIPANWLQTLTTTQNVLGNASDNEIDNAINGDRLSQTLYRKWLGALTSQKSSFVTAIAAHQVMQRRSSLKLVSQCEPSD